MGTTTVTCGINTFKRKMREYTEVTKAVLVSFTENKEGFSLLA